MKEKIRKTELIDLEIDQLLVIATENNTYRFGVVQEAYDDLLFIAKQGGGLLVYQTPCETREIAPVFDDGEPVLLKKNIFGNYKFPKARV